MHSETGAIPEPPREARWRTCLARRWVLGAIGGTAALLGLLILVASWLQADHAPFDDAVLDSGGWTASGTVLEVRQRNDGIWEVRYEFEADGAVRGGTSYAESRTDAMRVGEPCTIEYLPGQPTINRLRGTQRGFIDPQLHTLLTVLLTAGLVMLFLWFRSALRLRIALREGRLTTAQIIEARRLRHVNPPPVRVHYRFQDGLGMEYVATHWVGVRSTLGQYLLAESTRTCPVIHDEGDPTLSRLVHAEDFLA